MRRRPSHAATHAEKAPRVRATPASAITPPRPRRRRATVTSHKTQALMLDEPRHATVTSTRPTKCFAISSHDFSRLFGPLRDLIQQQMRMRILKSVPLLSHLDDHVLDKLADAMRIQLFDAGKYVIKEGDKGSRFYIINAGAAKVTKNTKTGEEDIGVLNANEFFGERALLSAEPRQANIIATEALECLVLDRDSFKKWLADVDDVRQKKAARDASTRRGAAQSLRSTTLTNIGYGYLWKGFTRSTYPYKQSLRPQSHAEIPNSRDPSRTQCASGEGFAAGVRASFCLSLSSDVPR